MSITLDEWMKELAAVEQAATSGFVSRADLMRAWKCSPCTANARMHQLVEDGQLEYAGRERRPCLDNTLRPVPVYRLINAKEKRKRP